MAYAREGHLPSDGSEGVLSLQVLPLAITMMAGPQIMSAIIFVTTERAVRTSLAFLTGVLAATTMGIAITRTLAALLGNAIPLGDASAQASVGNIAQYLLIGLLLAAAVKSYLRRESAEPPRWLGTLMTAGPRKALRTGFLLILFFPSDILVMLTVGTNLEQNQARLVEALPFIGATAFVAALPLLSYLLFHRRAKTAMPKVRDWMNSHTWLVNILAYLFFILIILVG